MKRIAIVLAAAALAVPAAQATAATPKGPTLAQFNALKKQVTTLQKQLKSSQNEVLGVEAYMICLTAATADTFQSTWQQEDATLQALGRQPVFGAQTPISDLNACQAAFNISRSHAVPPSASTFGSLTALFGKSYRFSALSLLLS